MVNEQAIIQSVDLEDICDSLFKHRWVQLFISIQEGFNPKGFLENKPYTEVSHFMSTLGYDKLHRRKQVTRSDIASTQSASWVSRCLKFPNFNGISGTDFQAQMKAQLKDKRSKKRRPTAEKGPLFFLLFTLKVESVYTKTTNETRTHNTILNTHH